MAQAPREVDGGAVLQQALNDDNPRPNKQALVPAPAGNQQENQAAVDVIN